MISARRKEYSLCGTMLRVTIFCGVMGSPPSSNRNLELDIQLSLILGTQYPEENQKKKECQDQGTYQLWIWTEDQDLYQRRFSDQYGKINGGNRDTHLLSRGRGRRVCCRTPSPPPGWPEHRALYRGAGPGWGNSPPNPPDYLKKSQYKRLQYQLGPHSPVHTINHAILICPSPLSGTNAISCDCPFKKGPLPSRLSRKTVIL